MKFRFIHDHRTCWPVPVMCRVLGVARSGFYAWRCRRPSDRHRRREELAAKVRRVHQQSRRTYGSPRVHAQLRSEGERVCLNTVAKVMAAEQVRGCRRRRYTPSTTDSRHDRPVAKNLLDRRFDASLPNRKWAADITYVPTKEGWLYLAAVIDLCSRKIVGFATADHLESDLVSEALKTAVRQRRPSPGLLHHSDRGSQYAGDDYQHLLHRCGMIGSMSRRGDCWDNAVIESFWGTLKSECVHRDDYATRHQAAGAIADYIETFYNRRRLHSALGYRSPESFEASLN